MQKTLKHYNRRKVSISLNANMFGIWGQQKAFLQKCTYHHNLVVTDCHIHQVAD